MNICQCGTQAGYPHPYGCPFPYYGNAVDIMRGWQLAAADLLAAIEGATLEAVTE